MEPRISLCPSHHMYVAQGEEMRYPSDYDSVYADGMMYDWHEDSIFFDPYDYSGNELDSESLEAYEYLVPADYVMDLVPEDWTVA